MDYLSAPAPGAPRCDSFFVEDAAADSRLYRPLMTDHQKYVKQMTIGWELSRLVSEDYQNEILGHMEDMEVDTLPDVASIELQAEIQWFMRPYLLDFLIEAHAAFRLLPETLHLAINLLDRYCSKRVVYKRHYQLVGCAALFIAAKFGDKKEKVPTVGELKSMCCALYDDEMFIQMEWHVLQTLDWVIGHPTIDGFIQVALTTEEAADLELEHMALYLSEIALFHKEFVSVRPSVLARSALTLARCILQRPSTNTSAWANFYDTTTILDLSQKMRNPSAVLSHKYNSHQLSFSSVVVEQFLERQLLLSQKYAAAAAVTSQTPPLELKSNAPAHNYLSPTPQTPQKNKFSVSAGILTPPITPEGECYVPEAQRICQIGPNRLPPTPTPESLDRRTDLYNFQQNHTMMPMVQ